MEEKIDYISQLHQDVIHHIYSFLTPKEVAVTSVLSKTWSQIFSTYEHLHFVFDFDRDYPPSAHIAHGDLIVRSQQKRFLAMIERYITNKIRWGSNLVMGCQVKSFFLHLSFPDPNMLKELLDGWILLTILHKIPKLGIHVDIISNGVRSYHTFPDLVRSYHTLPYLGSTLNTLSLRGFMVREIDFGLLSNLENITLTRCRFSSNAFQNMLGVCKRIRQLQVSNSDGFPTELSISNLPALKIFHFSKCKRITVFDVDVPSLEACSVTFPIGKWPEVSFLPNFISLKELTMNGARFSGDFSVNNIVTKLPNLEILELASCIDSGSINISSKSLKKLILNNVQVQGYSISTPNLQILECRLCTEVLAPLVLVPSHASTNLMSEITFEIEMKSITCIMKWKDFIYSLVAENDMKVIIDFESEDEELIMHVEVDKGINEGTLTKIFNNPAIKGCSAFVYLSVSLKTLNHLTDIRQRLTSHNI